MYPNFYNNGYDQLLLVPLDTINPEEFYSAMQIINPSWINNVQLLSINTYFTDLLINNLVKCIFVSLAFLMIFNFLMLNIISVIPIFMTSLFTILLGVAIIGATRISINLNTISAFSTGFIVLQLLIITNYMSLKFHYGMKTRLSNKEILSYSLKQTKSLLIISISIIVSL